MIRIVNFTGENKILPVTFYISEVPFDVNLPSQPLYGRDGIVNTGNKTIRDKRFTIDGTLIHNVQAELDSLMAFLLEPPLEIYKHHADDRFLKAILVGAPQTVKNLGKEIKLRLQMQALDPFWYGAEVIEEVNGTQNILVDGNVLTRPLIKTVNPVTGLNISNGRQTIEMLSGESGIIEIDNENYTVKVGGVNRLDLINNQWLLDGFHLVPGENVITSNEAIKITYRPKWY